jgi:Holliday junction resolvase RusA-like endonuclease
MEINRSDSRVEIDFGFVPESAKNSRRIVVVRGMPRIIASKKALQQERAIKQALQLVFARGPLWSDQDIGMRIEHHVLAGTVRAVVEPLGPRPKGVTGRRRDLHNLSVMIPDTMEGFVFSNDNQVSKLAMERIL